MRQLLTDVRAKKMLAVLLVGLLAATLVLQAPRTVAAGELKDLNTSLKLMPKDTAFYCSMMRCGEKFKAIGDSRAWAKLMDLPAVQQGLAIYNIQAANPDSVPGQIQTTLKNPETKELLSMLADMGSEEMFLYGGKDFAGTMTLLQDMVNTQNNGPKFMKLTGEDADLDDAQVRQMLLMLSLSENLDKLKAPNMVMGFKVKDKDRVKAQLAKLQVISNILLMQAPEMEGRFKQETIDGSKYLTLSLDGEMIPVDDADVERLKAMETEPGDADKLIAAVKKVTVKIALGLRGDYLLLSIGSSTEMLEKLGKGELLIDREEFHPLTKYSEERLTSISYVSKDMMAALSTGKRDIDSLVELVDEFLPMAELTEEQTAQIKKDAAALGEDLKTFVPEPGAVLSFGFLADKGAESYTYNWTENLQLDGSQPLGLLGHVGGDPLLAIVGRGKHDPAQYDLLVKWVKVGYGYFETFGLPNMPKSERKKTKKALNKIKPLAKRLDTATADMLIPALADGQFGLVVDTKLKSKQFHVLMPETEHAMPMLEPALVIGVSDAELLRKACGEYREIIDGVLKILGDIKGSEVPKGLTVPEPEVVETSGCTTYGYALPEQWGLDKKIIPNAGLSKSVAVLSISRGHTQRLLNATPLKTGGLLSESDDKLAMAVVFDWTELLEAITPWVDYAVENATEIAGPQVETTEVASQVKTVLEVLGVLRAVTSKTTIEDDATVTHTLVEFGDIE